MFTLIDDWPALYKHLKLHPIKRGYQRQDCACPWFAARLVQEGGDRLISYIPDSFSETLALSFVDGVDRSNLVSDHHLERDPVLYTLGRVAAEQLGLDHMEDDE